MISLAVGMRLSQRVCDDAVMMAGPFLKALMAVIPMHPGNSLHKGKDVPVDLISRLGARVFQGSRLGIFFSFISGALNATSLLHRGC